MVATCSRENAANKGACLPKNVQTIARNHNSKTLTNGQAVGEFHPFLFWGRGVWFCPGLFATTESPDVHRIRTRLVQ